MPSVRSPGGEVDWPAGEGTIGIVGVAPWATLELCRALYEQVRAQKDWHYPRVLVDINTKLPSRGRHLQLGEADPSPYIADTIRELAENGATVAVVACNTAHILYERWAAGAPIPVLNIVEVTIEQAAAAGARRIAALTSSTLASYDVYGRAASDRGIATYRLNERRQDTVAACIESIKVGKDISVDEKRRLRTLLDDLRVANVDTVLLGCTELTAVAALVRAAGFRVTDSNAALATAALRSIGFTRIRASTT